MRYILLIALLLAAGSVAADTVFVHGVNADGGSQPNDIFIVHPITISSGTYTLDSIRVRLYTVAGDDSVRCAVYRAYGDSSLVDSTQHWEAVNGYTDNRLTFQIGDTVKQDSTYWFGLAGTQDEVLRWNRDDTSLSIPSYYFFTHAWATGWPSTMYSLGDGTEHTFDRMHVMLVYGTEVEAEEPSGSRVIYWGNATLGKGRHGCAD
jgi:hypothetical protein